MTDAKPTHDLWAYWRVLLDERVRTYVVMTAAALLVIFLLQILAGSLLAGGVPLALGLLALGLRWPGLPMLCVIAVAYFQALPFAVPLGNEPPVDPHETHFRILDLLLVLAVLVYLAAQYRVYALAHLAAPDERLGRHRPAEKPALRDPDLIDEAEVPKLVLGAVAALLLGQAVWLAVSETVLDFHRLPPVRLRETGFLARNSGALPPAASRWMLFVLALGVLIFVARLAFWYWRLRTLSRVEGQMILADTGWREMRREAARQETWRLWGKLRSRQQRPKPKPKPKPQVQEKPWMGAAIARAFLLVSIAVVVTIVLVCAGTWLIEGRR